jgi:hypothetical protein
VQLPLRYKRGIPSTTNPLRILGDGVYELKEGYGDWELGDGDVVKLRLGGVVTGSTSQKLVEHVHVW